MDMNDRELLELAAKAAGYEGTVTEYPSGYVEMGLSNHFSPNGSNVWKPLHDDSDALRPAVKLHIDIKHFMYEHGYMDCLVDRMGRSFRESLNNDPYAATRRTIVCAAAEIGKAMT